MAFEADEPLKASGFYVFDDTTTNLADIVVTTDYTRSRRKTYIYLELKN